MLQSDPLQNLMDSQNSAYDLEVIQMNIKSLKDQLNELEGTKKIMEKWGDTVKEGDKCPLCTQNCLGEIKQHLQNKVGFLNTIYLLLF